MSSGAQAFEKGAFDAAATHWKTAAQLYRTAGESTGQIDATIRLASACQSSGRITLAIEQLTDAVNLAEAAGDKRRLVLAQSNLGAAFSATWQTDRAEATLQQALAVATEQQDWNGCADIYNNLGSVHAAQTKYAEALAAFQKSRTFAVETRNRPTAAKAAANAASVAARAGMTPSDTEKLNDSAVTDVHALDRSHEQAYLLLLCGQTFRQLTLRASSAQARLRLKTADAYEHGLRVAEALGDQLAASYALGYLGQLEDDQRHDDEALSLTRRAAFRAQQAQSPDALYRWEWQTARLLKARNDTEAAIAAYGRAIQTLQTIRRDFASGCRRCSARSSFRESFGAVYLELADLLLRQADAAREPQRTQQLLLQARDTIEQLKSVELEDYFQDQCVTRSRSTPIENLGQGTAVLYLIPLSDRTEVLVSYGSEMARFKAPVGVERLTSEVREFRSHLEKRTTHEYLREARHLYDWLIRPIRGELTARGVQTLVFVPDGALRTIPLAALHDGDHFLVNDFAVAVTPGLTLTAPEAGRREHPELLLAGLSQSVQGFAPLDYVPTEVERMQHLYRSDTLLNQSFLDTRLKRRFADQQYSLVHIASHGHFDRDADQTFILTYDAKLTLDDLEALIRPSAFRGKPVDLLTLSACQTAAGDDRAALGLAGVAVKAGARSALATLWFVNDQASTALVSDFYSAWNATPAVTKARALQAAQLKMLADRRYRHPCYWAPYLLIGNWL